MPITIKTTKNALTNWKRAVTSGKGATEAAAIIFSDLAAAVEAGNKPDLTLLCNMFGACEKGDTYQTRLKLVVQAAFGPKSRFKVAKDGTVSFKPETEMDTSVAGVLANLAADEVSFVGPKIMEKFGKETGASKRTFEQRIATLATDVSRIQTTFSKSRNDVISALMAELDRQAAEEEADTPVRSKVAA